MPKYTSLQPSNAQQLFESLLHQAGFAALLRHETLKGLGIHDDRGHLPQQLRADAPGMAELPMAALQAGHAAGVAGHEAGEAFLAMHVTAHLLGETDI